MLIRLTAPMSVPFVSSYAFPAVVVLVASLAALAVAGGWMLWQRSERNTRRSPAPAVASPASLPFLASPATESPSAESSSADDLAETVPKAPRRPAARPAPMTGWRLETEHGQRVALTKATVIVGRDPRAPEGVTDAQLVALKDCEFSVSKTHARLDLVDGSWLVTDLHSTNGVRLAVKPAFLPEDRIDVGVPAHAAAHLSFGRLSARILRLS